MMGSVAAATTLGNAAAAAVSVVSDHGESQSSARGPSGSGGLSRTFTRQFSQPIVFSSDSDEDDAASANIAAKATAASAAAAIAAPAASLLNTGLYRTELQEVEVGTLASGYVHAGNTVDWAPPQRWLLIGEDARVRTALESRGAYVVTVTKEAWFNGDHSTAATPMHNEQQDYYQTHQRSTDWIGEVVNSRGAAWDGVALCEALPWAVALPDSAASLLGRDNATSSSSRRVVHAAETAADLLVATIRAIVSGGGGSHSNSSASFGSGTGAAVTQLLVCTSGAFSTPAAITPTVAGRKKISGIVTHAPLAAVCRVANADHPDKLRCAVLDLQPETASINPAALDALFWRGTIDGGGGGANVGDASIATSEDEAIVIADRVYVPRLRRFSLDEDPSCFNDQRRQTPAVPLSRVFRPQACCVITGGTGRDFAFYTTIYC